MEKNTPHFLRISGNLPSNKRKEFQQTIQFVFNQLTKDCIEHSLSTDVFAEGQYYFFSIWMNASSLKSFMASVEFQLLTGAFFTLGDERSIAHGPKSEIDTFLVSNMN